MPIPAPQPDASGGYIVTKYTDGVTTHRQRMHVLAFNADSTGSYVTPPSGGEASVAATWTALAGFLAPFLKTTWTMSLDAVFRNSVGVISEVFTVTPPATVAGTSTGTVPIAAVYTAFMLRTAGGHQFRCMVFSSPVSAPPSVNSFVANSSGNAYQKLCAYLQASTTALVGHDNTKPIGNMRSVDGINKRLRRKLGYA